MGIFFSFLLRGIGTLLMRFFVKYGETLTISLIYAIAARFLFFYAKVGIFVALVWGVISSIQALANTISAAMPDMLNEGIGRILPDNFYVCVSAILVAKFVVFTLHVKDRLLNMIGTF